MNALVADPASPFKVAFAEVPGPEPGPGQVLVDVRHPTLKSAGRSWWRSLSCSAPGHRQPISLTSVYNGEGLADRAERLRTLLDLVAA